MTLHLRIVEKKIENYNRDSLPYERSLIIPLQSIGISEARVEGIRKLDEEDISRDIDRYPYEIDKAMIYRLELDITKEYETDKYKRQSQIEKQKKLEELKKMEAEVDKLKKELESWN